VLNPHLWLGPLARPVLKSQIQFQWCLWCDNCRSDSDAALHSCRHFKFKTNIIIFSSTYSASLTDNSFDSLIQMDFYADESLGHWTPLILILYLVWRSRWLKTVLFGNKKIQPETSSATSPNLSRNLDWSFSYDPNKQERQTLGWFDLVALVLRGPPPPRYRCKSLSKRRWPAFISANP
jgi:hypothetical protein